MAKYAFDTTIYSGLWSKDAKFLGSFIDKSAMIQMNNMFWASQFTVSPDIIPTDSKGIAAFSVDAHKIEAAPVMDLRAPYGTANPKDEQGIATQLGTIPNFITRGWRESAQERMDRIERFEQYRDERELLDQWSNKVQWLVDSANSTLSNMAAQVLSTGKIFWNFGTGIKNTPLLKMDIPEENFVKAGEYVWTDTENCPLLEQMVKIEQDWRNATGFEGAMKWQYPVEYFHQTFMANKQVKKWINDTRTLKELPTTNNMLFTEAEVLQYVSTYPNLSPIELIKEQQRDMSWDTATNINGWEATKVVLRPVGYAGEIQRTNELDEKLFKAMGATDVQKIFTRMNSGLCTLVNTTMNNGDYREWQTHMVMSAIPVLNEFPYHVIVDTTTADE